MRVLCYRTSADPDIFLGGGGGGGSTTFRENLTRKNKKKENNNKKLDMCLWNTDANSGNKVKMWQKISKSYILTLLHPQGHGMSVKCEETLYELTVKVWLLYLHLNFNYWTL